MILAIDVDGTADADPGMFCALMCAVKAAGGRVVVLTGASDSTIQPGEMQAKAEYLSKLGLGHAWDELVVFPSPPHAAKAQWCKDNGVDVLIDNSIKTAKKATSFCTVLVPWATREK